MTTRAERTYNSGPLVVKDKVLVGAGNCGPGSANLGIEGEVAGYSPPGGCFITGHDLETGKELWRFNTIAHSTSRAATPGTICRMISATARPSGRLDSTTRS